MHRRLLKKRRIASLMLKLFISLFLFIKLFHLYSNYANYRLQPYFYPVSCNDLFNNQSDALQHASTMLSERLRHPIVISDREYIFPVEHCPAYLSVRFNEPFHWNDALKNQQFPLAFTILLHENVEQFERLLRLIYRRQNFYCIHIDADASTDVVRAIRSISQCFANVFLSTRRENVIYATFSRLQADINCMADLLRYPSWKYLLNIANSELPLRTNSELVEILTLYRGFNDIEGRWKSRRPKRTNFVWKLSDSTEKTWLTPLRMTNISKSAPPSNLKIVKGSAYGMHLDQTVITSRMLYHF